MADYTLFTNPLSRRQIARWARHDAGADYDKHLVDWLDKPQRLLDVNPRGKLPTRVHHHNGHDHVVRPTYKSAKAVDMKLFEEAKNG